MSLDWVKTRQTKYGAYSATYILVVVACLVFVNYLADRYNKTFDATKDQIYSLSDQSLKILGNLDRDLKIYYFDKSMEFGAVKDSLVRYENASSRVTVDYIDPDSKPEVAKAMNVRNYGTVFVEVGANREEASSTSEEDITNSIIKALKGEEKTACILSGHGEADASDTGRDGFSGAKDAIEDANYKTQTISLLEKQEIPSECTLLILAGAETGYFEQELDILKKYIEGGGRLAVMLDNEKSPELAEWLAGFGIKVRDEIVLDFSGIGQFFGMGPLSPLVASYEDHPISNVMGNVTTFFPMARGVESGDATANWTVTNLFRTTAQSFATEELKIENEEVIRNADKEREGPITLGVAAVYDPPGSAGDTDEDEGDADDAEEDEAEEDDADADASEDGEAEDKPQGRIVATGTSLFVRNASLGRGGNVDLFLNMLNWLSSDEDLISIRPKDPESTPLNLSQSEMSRLFWLNVVLLPLAILALGIRVWWVQR